MRVAAAGAWPARSACPTPSRRAGCRPRPPETARAGARRRPRRAGARRESAVATSIQPRRRRSRRRRTGRSPAGAARRSAARPALRARAAVNGDRGRARRPRRPTAAPRRRCRRSSPNRHRRSVATRPRSEARQASSRAPSLRPMTTAPIRSAAVGGSAAAGSSAASERGRVVHASVNSVLTAATQAGADPSGQPAYPGCEFTKRLPGTWSQTEARCRTALPTSMLLVWPLVDGRALPHAAGRARADLVDPRRLSAAAAGRRLRLPADPAARQVLDREPLRLCRLRR